MQLTTIPRTVVKVTLDGLRLPLTTAERIAGQAENPAWPPSVMFEGFEAGAKQFAGALLRDSDLVEEGRIQQAKVAELRRAVELEVKAEQTREQANAHLAAERERAERDRVQAEQQARQREQAIERDKRAAEQKVAAEAQRAEQAIDAVDRARQKKLAAEERNARLAKVEAESAALAKQRDAVASAEQVARLANAAEAKKAKRKSS